MRKSSNNWRLASRIGVGLLVILFLCPLNPYASSTAWAAKKVTKEQKVKKVAEVKEVPRLTLTTTSLPVICTNPPEFLCPAPTGNKSKEPGVKKEEVEIAPFISADQALPPLPSPERPSSDRPFLDRPDVTAGVKIDTGAFKLDLGYTLPSGQVDELVRPLGVDLQPGPDVKRFSLGVKIPF